MPLSFRSGKSGYESFSIATAALSNTRLGNLVIEGAPGSGKSTLLKAYGVGILQTYRSGWRRTQRTVPFLIQLRKLARTLETGSTVADYLINQILVSGVGMPPSQAKQFLRYALEREEALVMLDGLDEVTVDRYDKLLEAVTEFRTDHDPSCPTFRARIFITCRRQNFIRLRDEWVPAIADRTCSLAPLRNAEIFSYLNKLRSKFKAVNGPEDFIQAVRASGTLDLHRVPLILAMSVGLYAHKDYFEIPSSIAKLYKAMIEEMLDRHRFKRDPGGGALACHMEDKYRLLSQFSLYAAMDSYGFDEFGKVDLVKFAESLAPELDDVRDADALVDEVILRSGLLTDVADTGRYVFAHRSIQEYLVAEELWSDADGDFVLLDRADDPEWRQVIQFYAAGREQRQLSRFLEELARRNPELAGYCLSSARASNETASTVLKALEPISDVRLASLAAATMCPRAPVQNMAIKLLRRALSSGSPSLAGISGNIDGMLPLLNSLSGTNAAEIAALVPQIILRAPDDPRLVEPLWRCLTAPGIEDLEACSAIVVRLLTLVEDWESFRELARQESYTRDFLTAENRHQAYPFKEGLDFNHNLVTLLTWAQYLDVSPYATQDISYVVNYYFAAKKAGHLKSLESDRRRTVAVSPFWPARFLSSLLALTALTSSIDNMVVNHSAVFEWWMLPLLIAGAYGPFLGFSIILDLIVRLLPTKRQRRLFYIRYQDSASGSIVGCLAHMLPELVACTLLAVIMPFSLSLGCLLLLEHGFLPAYLGVLLGGSLLYWAMFLNFFRRGSRFYLYRPNPYIDIYDDSRTRHWVRDSQDEPVKVEVTDQGFAL